MIYVKCCVPFCRVIVLENRKRSGKPLYGTKSKCLMSWLEGILHSIIYSVLYAMMILCRMQNLLLKWQNEIEKGPLKRTDRVCAKHLTENEIYLIRIESNSPSVERKLVSNERNRSSRMAPFPQFFLNIRCIWKKPNVTIESRLRRERATWT